VLSVTRAHIKESRRVAAPVLDIIIIPYILTNNHTIKFTCSTVCGKENNKLDFSNLKKV